MSEHGATDAARLGVQLRGYRMDQVDAVLDRLEARVAANDATIARLTDLCGLEGHAGRDGSPSERADLEDPPTRADMPARDDAPAPATAEPAQRAERREPRLRLTDVGWLAGPSAEATDADHPGQGATAARRGLDRWDLAALAAYLVMATYVMSGFIGRARTGYLSQGVQDQQAFEWYFGASAHNVLTLSNPLFSDRQNFPTGVNLMSNAAMVGIGVPMTPLTRLVGGWATFLVVEWLGLALTAFAWYWLIHRRLGVGRAGAAVGGWFAGFAPAMVSHANGHPNFVAQFLVPVIIDRVLRLERDGRTLRDGVVLGLLVAWQLLIGEEVLLLASIGIVLVGVVLVAHRRVRLLRMLPGVGVGALVALAVAGLPLWWQFRGPQSYASLWHPPAGNDLAALWGRATRTFGADPWAAAALSMNRTEENAFFGWPLLVLVLVLLVLLVRRPLVRGLALLLVVTLWMSLGEKPTQHGKPVSVPSLWSLAEKLPVIENVLPSRLSLVAVPAIGVLLALGIEAARRVARHRMGEWAAVAIAVLALLPVVPTPLVVDERPAMPAFFSDGTWRGFVSGGSVLAVPPTDITDCRALEWQDETRMAFPVVEGYFVGPDGAGQGGGTYGAVRRPMSLWLYQIGQDGVARPPTVQQRAEFVKDLSAWRTDAVVLPPRPGREAFRSSLTAFLGEPREVGGVLVWDVRRARV